MLLGEFERAWRETDRIEQLRRSGIPVKDTLLWDGRDFKDRRVLLHCNRGLGDAIQFLRFAPHVKKRCRHLIIKAMPLLAPLLKTINWVDTVLAAEDPDPAAEVEMESTELPYVFRTTLQTIPEPDYLPLPRVAAPSQSNALRVGLAWAAGPWNHKRSIRLSEFNLLHDLQGLSFSSLQWGGPADECNTADLKLTLDTSESVREDILATAHAVLRADLVITVDSMIAHLAGTLRRPVWVLLCADSDWRWLLDREDTPWYPTMRLFRQRSPGDWSAPLQRVRRELESLLATRNA